MRIDEGITNGNTLKRKNEVTSSSSNLILFNNFSSNIGNVLSSVTFTSNEQGGVKENSIVVTTRTGVEGNKRLVELLTDNSFVVREIRVLIGTRETNSDGLINEKDVVFVCPGIRVGFNNLSSINVQNSVRTIFKVSTFHAT